MLIHRFLSKGLAALLWGTTIFSFIISVYGMYHHDKATFYLLPTRAWELLFGALAATGYFALPQKKSIREIASALGFILIVATLFLLNDEHKFPGYNALYPCLGALLIITAGKDDFTPRFNQLLSFKPIVFIGLISYSFYLWHWPVFVYTKHFFYGSLTLSQQWGMIIASLLLAALSWHFVERPFRGKTSPFNRKQIFTLSGVGMVLFAAFAYVGIQQKGLPQRFDGEVLRLASYEKSKYKVPRECRPDKQKKPLKAPSCIVDNASEPAKIILWGDSHTGALAPVLSKASIRHNLSLGHYYFMGCPIFYGLDRMDKTEDLCKDFCKLSAHKIINDKNIQTVILVGRWSDYTQGSTWKYGPAEKKKREFGTLEERQADYTTAFHQTMDALLNAGKKVVLSYPIPEIAYKVPNTLAQKLMLEGQMPEQFAVPFENYKERHKFIFSLFDRYNHPNLVKVYPHKLLCDDKVCKTYANGHALYYDDDHLSLEGAEYILPLFEPYLK